MKLYDTILNPKLSHFLERPETKIGQALIELRTKKGLSQATVAQFVHLKEQDYILMESGVLDRPIQTYSTVLKQLQYFDVKLGQG